MMITIDNITTGYGNKIVLDHFSAQFDDADFCAVMGPNGAGKSTLLRTMAGLQSIQTGSILIDQKNINRFKTKELARQIAFVPQREDLVFEFSVFDTVMMGRNPYQNRWEWANQNDVPLVENILEQTHLQHLKNRLLSQLSGGELRRTMIARAIAQQTPIILLDEPLANLDIVHQFEIMEILIELNKNHAVTIIIILHDFPFAIQYTHHTLLMKDGKIQHFGNTSQVLSKENVHQCFGLSQEFEYFSNGLVVKK